jgi:hypothetical protein
MAHEPAAANHKNVGGDSEFTPYRDTSSDAAQMLGRRMKSPDSCPARPMGAYWGICSKS